MSENDIARVKKDLETMESAIGLSRSWDPREVRIHLLFAASGLAAAGWAIVPHGLTPMLGLCFFIVPMAEWLRSASALPKERQFLRRDFQSAFRTLWLLAPLLAFFFWCRHIGLLPLEFLGLATFLVGAVLFSAAVGKRYERTYLGWSVALMSGGLALPLEIAPAVAVLATALGFGGLISAVLAFAAREDSSNYAAS